MWQKAQLKLQSGSTADKGIIKHENVTFASRGRQNKMAGHLYTFVCKELFKGMENEKFLIGG